jgi:transposase
MVPLKDSVEKENSSIRYENLSRTRKSTARVINEAVKDGALNILDIAERIGLSYSIVYKYLDEGIVKFPEGFVRRRKCREERVKSIRKAFENGEASSDVIAENIGLAPKTVYYYARCEGIELIHPQRTGVGLNERKIEVIRGALDEGVRSLEEICRRSRLRPSGLRRYCEEAKIELPEDMIPCGDRPEIDRLVLEGKSSVEIGNLFNLSYQTILNYIRDTGQYKSWRSKGEKVTKANSVKTRKKLRGTIAFLLKGRLTQLAEEESWAHQKAIEYMNQRKGHRNKGKSPNYSFDLLLTLFERYEHAKERGQKISLEKLADGLGIWPVSAGVILKKMELEPLYGTRERSSNLSRKMIATIDRGFDLELSCTDIACFLNLNYWNVQGRFAKLGKRLNSKKAIKFFKREVEKGTGSLNYSLASQIYEAQDLDFNGDEIAELLDLNPKIVEYAVRRRKKIEPKLLDQLRILYGKEKIDKPYKAKFDA